MMNKFLHTLTLSIGLLLIAPAQAAEQKIEFVEFKNAKIEDATRILASMANANIAVTDAASGTSINLLLRNTDLTHAIDTLSRVSGLWYRYSKSNNSFLIMTEEQYQDDIVIYRDDIIRTFTLRHQNVKSAAQTIKNLYGDRVQLALLDDNNGFEGLDFDTVDDATVVARNDKNTNTAEFTNTSSPTNPDDDKQLSEQELSRGVIKQLGNAERVDANKANRLIGATTPIHISTNAMHNLMFVRTSDENAMAEIEKVIQESDRPTPQVMLEMKIVRINVGDEYNQDFDLTFNDASAIENMTVTGETTVGNAELGSLNLNLGASSTTSSSGSDLGTIIRNLSQLSGDDVSSLGFSGATGGFYQLYSKYVNARIALLEKNNQAEAIAKPVIMASNNRPAKLFIGEEQVIAVGLNSTTNFSGANESGDRTSETTSTLETERRKVGNTLILLPSINADRTVTIDILQETSTVKIGGLRFPFFDNNSNSIKSVDLDAVEEANIKTVVIAQDGYTIALGGMINNDQSKSESKVPLLGDLPILGDLFKSKNDKDSHSQYVMLLTPHILLSPEESREKSREISEFDYDTYKEPNTDEAQTTDYKVADYIALSRYAIAQAHQQPLPDLAGVNLMPVSQQPLSVLLSNNNLAAWPVGSAEKQGLYITTVKIRNQSDEVQAIDLSKLPGHWLAATADQTRLGVFNQGADSTFLYLLSDKPFANITAPLTRGIQP